MSSASRLGRGDFGERLGNLVGRVGWEAEFEQRDRGHIETRETGAAIDEHRDADRRATGFANDVEALKHAAAAGDDVFDNENFFARLERETASHDEDVVFLFGEDVARAGLAGDFLAEDEAAHRRGQHGRELERCEFRDEQFGQAGDGAHVLADLRALEEVAAVQAGAEHEVPFEEGAGAFEDGEDFLLLLIHAADGGSAREKNKNFFATVARDDQGGRVVIEYAPLEDELGDVLEKAMRHCGVSEQSLAERASVPLEKIRDAIDYRYDFSPDELRQLAKALALNEVGLLALAQRTYPLPEISGLPFCVHPLRMPHGIGVANAYIVAECGSGHGLLFDTGPEYAQLRRFWPKAIRSVDAVFVTHAETEHTGGLEALRDEQPRVPVFGPGSAGKFLPGLTAPADDARLTFGDFEVRVLRTPGHAEAHNCYLISVPKLAQAPALLISGDLIFAGSVGGAFYCQRRLVENFRRLMSELPENTVIAPGHGPLTTIKNERRFNPFVL